MSTPTTSSVVLSNRRAKLSASRQYVGIDYIGVSRPEPVAPTWELAVFFIPVTPGASAEQWGIVSGITAANIRLTDVYGIPTPSLAVVKPHVTIYPSPSGGNQLVLKVTVGPSGSQQLAYDFRQSSTYLFELINVPGIDRFFSHAPFTLDSGQAVTIDPKPVPSLAEVPQLAAEIDYLAKDFNSFKQLMLDQLSLIVPQWKERHETDIGMVLVEIMAYAADYLSYFQDSVGTEAYLGTARRRVSVRRHARLLDYPLNEGCNARAWVYFNVNGSEPFFLPAGTPLLTRGRGNETTTVADSLDEALKGEPVQFETMYESTLYPTHNRMDFYTWGPGEAVLAEGATTATLVEYFPYLKAGDVLIFEETEGVMIGEVGNNARRRCHAVRLSETPKPMTDPLYNNQELTQIDWYADDALPFEMVVSAQNQSDGTGRSTVALGNIVLADQGRTIVPPERVYLPVAALGPFSPRLAYTDITFRVPDDPSVEAVSAATAVKQDPSASRPAIRLREVPDDENDGPQFDAFAPEESWTARRDLLNSGPFAQDFVVETESDGSIYLRFGNNQQGARPAPGSVFDVTYRVGNGTYGNVGPNTIRRVVLNDAGYINVVRNPLAATGGTDPESLDEVRLNAPQAFDTQERAVTPDDYTVVAKRFPGVQNAATRILWTGSWLTAFVYVQREDGRPLDAAYRDALNDFMENYRIIGADVEISAPYYVPLEIKLAVYVGPHHPQSVVLRRLVETFSTSVLPDGSYGFFYPGNFTFGQAVYLSRIIAAAMGVPGVVRVEALHFKRMAQPSRDEIKTGIIDINALEIARLDNDARAPENGTIAFDMRSAV
ncbi:MAG: hypothetical protein QOJ76_1628 [Acidobacteriota bacterium]|nr:hypothetical protein [Acidobacteriota bacterium]